MLDKNRRWSAPHVVVTSSSTFREVRQSSVLVSELADAVKGFKKLDARLKRLGFVLASCGVHAGEVTDLDMKSDTAKVSRFFTFSGQISYRRGTALLQAAVFTIGAPKKAYASLETLIPYARVRMVSLASTRHPVPPGKGRTAACRAHARELVEGNCEALTPGMEILVPYLSNRTGKGGRMKVFTSRFKVEDFVPAWRTAPHTEADTLRESCRLFWNELCCVPVDRQGRIEKSFRHFPRRTALRAIHRWFERVFHVSVDDLKQTTGAKS